jgi:hypothetical protein
MPLDAKQAVKAAMLYLADIYPPEELKDMLLEEIDTATTGDSWLVTVSFFRPQTYPTGSFGSMFGGSQRHYKVISVDKETGVINSMKMRTSAADAQRS